MDGIVNTLIIAIGRDEIFFSPIADSIAFAAEDLIIKFYIKKYCTPQIVVAPDIIIDTFLSIFSIFPNLYPITNMIIVSTY